MQILLWMVAGNKGEWSYDPKSSTERDFVFLRNKPPGGKQAATANKVKAKSEQAEEELKQPVKKRKKR